MVDSAKGITNFHSPSDVIVDASMPAMIRLGGKMYGADGRTKDTKAVNPESTFSRIYQEIINFCKTHGQFDPTTMGTVPNVGLMAQQAEEYGCHDKTFEIPEDGVANIVDIDTGEVLLTQNVEEGDIWRMPVVKDARDPRLGQAGRHPGARLGHAGGVLAGPGTSARGRAAQEGQDVPDDHDTEGLDIQIMSQVRAMRHTIERAMRGQDTIAATGNILRDYLTDLFPILELGTSAKMLSIVPLMAGGGMYETGAGGSAPKHVTSWSRRTTCAGIRSANSSRWERVSKTSASRPATSGPRFWARRSTPRSASCWTTTRARRARPVSSTTAAASSTWRCTGRRNSPRRPTTKSCASTSPRWPSRWARTKTPSWPNSPRRKANPSTSAATTTRTARRPQR